MRAGSLLKKLPALVKRQNAQIYVPDVALRPQVARDLRSVFNSTERAEAD